MAGRRAAAGMRDRPAARATDREVGVVAAVLAAGSEKAAAHRLGPVALDRQAPPGKRTVQSGGGDDRATRMDPRPAPVGARGDGTRGA